MTREERVTELLSDDTQYCPYCGDERGSKFQCCGEVHFQTFYEMTVSEQDEFLSNEEFN